MGHHIHDLGIDELAIEDRIALVQDIWDSVAKETHLVPLSSEARAELHRRYKQDEASPGDVTDWKDIKQEALARWRR